MFVCCTSHDGALTLCHSDDSEGSCETMRNSSLVTRPRITSLVFWGLHSLPGAIAVPRPVLAMAERGAGWKRRLLPNDVYTRATDMLWDGWDWDSVGLKRVRFRFFGYTFWIPISKTIPETNQLTYSTASIHADLCIVYLEGSKRVGLKQGCHHPWAGWFNQHIWIWMQSFWLVLGPWIIPPCSWQWLWVLTLPISWILL